MSFWNIIESILLGPLKLVFEVIFEIANRFIGHPGLAIIVLSLIMNILVLPLYKRADAMQEESRDIENKLRKGIAHIKKTFSGDERMMILQTYYRQNNYKPTQALNGSVSLLLEIPFFMAAYQFLSHLGALEGVSLGPIADLSKPDGLLWGVNLLPILMTLVNVVSSAIYLKGFPLKTKIQLYGMALFFLVFLYTSPSGLVFYWTLNNVFSLVKTVFYKLKNPKKVLSVLVFLAGLGLLFLGVLGNFTSTKRKVFLIAVGVAMQLPMLWMLFKNKLPKLPQAKETKPNKLLFVMGSVFLTILVGLLIPSTFIAASPQEYVDYSYFHHPLWYVLSATCLSAGTFLVWLRVFYWLASTKGKVIFERLVWVLCGVMLVNYMFFGTDLGVISSTLQYDGGMAFSGTEQVINVLVLCALGAVMYFVATKWSKLATMVVLAAAVALGGMSVVNIFKIKTSVDQVIEMHENDENMNDGPSIQLSKNGKNVIVLMLDRALGFDIPYIFNEKPQLKEQFSGFVYYSNTMSFGVATNVGAPAVFGGYEYTPIEMNRRSEETLVSKHNEALKVMPKLFADNGYDVTIIDPPYANYQWISDMSIYDDIEGAEAYIVKGFFADEETNAKSLIQNNNRNFFCFSMMKTMPIALQSTIYDDGNYNNAGTNLEDVSYTTQTRTGNAKSVGYNAGFMPPYNVLRNMDTMTLVTEEETNTFLCMANDTTHDPMLLQTPDYVPAAEVDNTEYENKNADRFTVDEKTLKTDTDIQMIHYHANMAAMLQLGEWFDYLQELGVYDNTRIILVSDHGRAVGQMDELILDDGSDERLDLEYYAPLLMVKDFNSTGFTTSTEFMTNADVPTLAVEDLIDNPVNPYTGKAINSDEKTAHDQFVSMSLDWDVSINNGNTFSPGWWATVKDDIWNKDNWTVIKEELVLTEYETP